MSEKVFRDPISRRALLRGVGASVALPWLESINAWGASASAVSAASEAPRRFAALFMSNGVLPEAWHAEGAGAQMKLSRSLAPLERHKKNLLAIRGLFNEIPHKTGGPHEGKCPNILSGAKALRVPEVRVATTMDQVMAKRIGHKTPLPSLVLGTEQPRLGLIGPYSALYGGAISWSSPTQAVPKEIYPSAAFNRLFSAADAERKGSILDAVHQDAVRLQGNVSRSDHRKLDEYLHSIRELEQRIARLQDTSHGEGWQPTLTDPDMNCPEAGLPSDAGVHFKLMLDIITLAFRMDKTRIISFMFNNDQSGFTFPQVDVRTGMHSVSHGNVGKEGYQRVNQFHVEHLAYLCDKLAKVDEGSRTLLENSMIFFTSNMMYGAKHDSNQLPILLLGKGGGTIASGRALDYLNQGDDRRRLCSLYLSLMDRMGVSLDQFGDATDRLADI